MSTLRQPRSPLRRPRLDFAAEAEGLWLVLTVLLLLAVLSVTLMA